MDREAGLAGPAYRAGTRRAGDRREALGMLGTTLHDQRGRAIRRVVVRLEHAVVERGDSHSARSIWRSLGPNGWPRWSQRIRQVDPRRGLARPPAPRAGTRWMGPSVVVGELGQDRRILGAADLVDAFLAATGLTATGPFPAGQVRARGRRGPRPGSILSPGERTRAELAPSPPSASTSWSSTSRPTISTCRPSNSSNPRFRIRGTLLLVSHDRRLPETVTTTRRVELPGTRCGAVQRTARELTSAPVSHRRVGRSRRTPSRGAPGPGGQLDQSKGVRGPGVSHCPMSSVTLRPAPLSTWR